MADAPQIQDSQPDVAASDIVSIGVFGFLVIVCSGEHDSYSEIQIGFTTDRALADAAVEVINADQEKRHRRNREYAEVREVEILNPNHSHHAIAALWRR